MSVFAVCLSSIVMISSHPAPASHLAKMATVFEEAGVGCTFEATEGAYQNFVRSGVAVNNFYENSSENFSSFLESHRAESAELARQIAKTHEMARAVIIGHGGKFPGLLFEAFEKHAPSVKRILYIDNYESFVPGEYSSLLMENIKKAQEVWFANANFVSEPIFSAKNVEADIKDKERFGVGISPLSERAVLQLVEDRKKGEVRRDFLRANGIEDRGQKILIYLGGANAEYYEHAFPTFLRILDGLDKETTVILQQHPRAVKEGNRDGMLFQAWKKVSDDKEKRAVVSVCPSDNAIAAADVISYYQTSAILLPLAAGIPMIQVGHETYFDAGVRNSLCTAVELQERRADESQQEYDISVQKAQQAFQSSVEAEMVTRISYDDLMRLVGVEKQWEDHLKQKVVLLVR